MNVQEFREQYPHLAHLEGNDLWNAMEMAVLQSQPYEPPKEGDDEIVHTVEYEGYTCDFTKGAIDAINRAFPPLPENAFSDFGLLMPDGTVIMNNDKSEK